MHKTEKNHLQLKHEEFYFCYLIRSVLFKLSKSPVKQLHREVTDGMTPQQMAVWQYHFRIFPSWDCSRGIFHVLGLFLADIKWHEITSRDILHNPGMLFSGVKLERRFESDFQAEWY